MDYVMRRRSTVGGTLENVLVTVTVTDGYRVEFVILIGPICRNFTSNFKRFRDMVTDRYKISIVTLGKPLQIEVTGQLAYLLNLFSKYF